MPRASRAFFRAGSQKSRPGKAGRARERKRDNRREVRTFIGPDGKRRCKKHGKVAYAKAGQAHTARVELTRAGLVDPGLEVYGCSYSGSWHLGHPDRWRSLERLVREAEARLIMREPHDPVTITMRWDDEIV